jgi:hypothetical protein
MHDGTLRVQLEHSKAASYAHSTSSTGATRAYAEQVAVPQTLPESLHYQGCRGVVERLDVLSTLRSSYSPPPSKFHFIC